MLKENDVPNPSQDHDQEAPGATVRFVKVLGESRFGNQVTGTEGLVCTSKGFVPKNTEENTQWACRNICISFLFCMCSTFLQLKMSLWTSRTHITERADISAKDLDLSRIPRDRLVLSDPILQRRSPNC